LFSSDKKLGSAKRNLDELVNGLASDSAKGKVWEYEI